MISWQSIIHKPLRGTALSHAEISENILNTLQRANTSAARVQCSDLLGSSSIRNQLSLKKCEQKLCDAGMASPRVLSVLTTANIQGGGLGDVKKYKTEQSQRKEERSSPRPPETGEKILKLEKKKKGIRLNPLPF